MGAWEGAHLAAAVFPTAECLGALRAIDAERGGERLMLVFNPQWQTDGQIVSDFGCATADFAPCEIHCKQASTKFAGAFEACRHSLNALYTITAWHTAGLAC